MTTEYFTLKEDGKIYVRGKFATDDIETEVSNQGEVKFALHSAFADSNGEWIYTYNTPYPLQCKVEKRTVQRHPNPDLWDMVALVTFSEPEEKDLSREEMDKLWASIGPSKEIKFNEAKPSSGVEETQEYKCIHCNGTGYSNKQPLGQ